MSGPTPINIIMRRKVLSAIDLHAGTSVLGWMSVKGEELGQVRFATSADNLRGWIKDIKQAS